MTPYVMIMESSEARTTASDLLFDDDVQALVEARRLFVREVVVSGARPLSLALGRRGPDGEVAWLTAWSSSR